MRESRRYYQTIKCFSLILLEGPLTYVLFGDMIVFSSIYSPCTPMIHQNVEVNKHIDAPSNISMTYNIYRIIMQSFPHLSPNHCRG